MGTHFNRGFTIIETMLVLAITGMLVAGIFVGVGSSIAIQRYRDAVDTFKTTIQNQYAELSSVRNDRSDNWSCDGSAATAENGSTLRGQSDCVLVGRLLVVNQGDFSVYTVVGREISTTPRADDITSLRQNYALNISNANVERDALEWGAVLAWPRSGSGSQTPITPRSLSMLFIRSPDSGQIYTFTSDSAPGTPTPVTLRGILVAGNGPTEGQRARTICINGNGLTPNDTASIYVSAYAAVPNAIEARTNDIITATGSTTQC